jgi:serine phosphatase RsbU (regulator of sigma subunit)
VFGAIILIGDESKMFSAGDLKLVTAIAMQAAPAIEIAHLHQVELEKAVIERDLQTAYKVQSGLLPRNVPILDGWKLAAYWKPAREVGGDFYEFIPLPDGRLVIAIADVSDKGVPAALVMANTHSVLRAITANLGESELVTPGMLLTRVNNVLYDNTPMNMFITCLLTILDVQTGQVWYANAGHNLPYKSTAEGIIELHATGVPLAIFPGVIYENHETSLGYGDSLLMYSDGLVEVHDLQGEMFGFSRLYQLLSNQNGSALLKGDALIQYLLSSLGEFTGPDWEQEDDVTIVALDRG